MRLLVTGGRDYKNVRLIYKALDRLLAERGRPDVLIHGKCRGVDLIADAWARECGIPTLAYPAQWCLHGRAAGPIRNGYMIKDSRADLVIAFPGNDGTANCVAQARAAGLEVLEIFDGERCYA